MAKEDNKLSEFMGNFYGGLRPNKFLVEHTFPLGTQLSNVAGVLSQYHIRAASMPPSTMTTIQVPYRGRIYKMPGIRTYATWQLTVLDDDKPREYYSAYHAWSNAIKEHYHNTTESGDMDFSDLMTDIKVKQLDYNGNIFREATLRYAWPSNVGPIALDMENNDSILTFQIDLEFQWMDEPGQTNNAASSTSLRGGGTVEGSPDAQVRS